MCKKLCTYLIKIDGVILAILGVSKMALGVPESKFQDQYNTIQTSPRNPQKATSGTRIGPGKVIFGHFAFFENFSVIFQSSVE